MCHFMIIKFINHIVNVQFREVRASLYSFVFKNSFYLDPYYTPQVKRKRTENEAQRVAEDLFTQEINIVKLMLKESHQKMDMIFTRQENFEKDVGDIHKVVSKLAQQVIKVT